MIPGGFVPLGTVTAAGDLIVGTGNGTVGRLAVGTAGQTLVPIAGTEAWRTRATNTQKPADPTGTTSASLTCMGLGSVATITPAVTGTVLFVITGRYKSSALAAVTITFFYGTGVAPVYGAAATGTNPGATYVVLPPAINQYGPFALNGLALGLTLGTAYWYDVVVASDGSDTANVGELTMTAVEL